MRSLVMGIFVFALAAGTIAARDESVDELKSRAEIAAPQDQPKLCVQIAELQLRNADTLYRNGDVEKARAAVDDIVTYSQKASASATETKKHLKNVEIAVRKMAERLRDIKRTLSFEDQPPVEHAIQELEKIRTSLLQQMFSKEKK
jgi:hypothetical protein